MERHKIPKILKVESTANVNRNRDEHARHSADRNVSILNMDSAGKEYTVNLDDYCRLCLRQYGSGRMQPLNSRSDNFGQEHVSITDMLVFVCGLPVNLSDNFPQSVCSRCVNQLEKVYRVCRQFKEKESILERFHATGSVLESLIQYDSLTYKTNTNELPNEDQNLASENLADEHQIETETAEELLMTVEQDSEQGEPKDVKACIVHTVQLENLNIPIQADDIPAKRPKYIVRPNGMFECMVCAQMYDNRDSCRQHCSSHEVLQAEFYKCRFCSKCFGKKCHLQTHEKGVHSDEIIGQDNAQTVDSHTVLSEFHLLEILDYETNNLLGEFQENCTKQEVMDPVDSDTALDREDLDSDALSVPDDATPIPKKGKTQLKRTFHHPEADGLYHCEYCSEKFSAKPKYLNHLYVHRALLAGRYKCQYCSKCFGKKWNVQKHEELVHQDEVAEKDPSSNPYKKSWTLTHERVYYTPEADGFFHCQHCQAKIENRTRFVQHMSKHRNLLRGRYKCRYCKKCFGKKYTLEQHEREVHRHEHIESDTEQSASSNNADDSEQKMPNEEPTADSEFQQTLEESHDTNTQENFTVEEEAPSGNSDAECELEVMYAEDRITPKPETKRSWPFTKGRVFYIPEADGLYHCPHCPQKIDDRKKFARHQYIHLAFLESRYKCSYCEKLFSKRCHLDRHVTKVHEDLPKRSKQLIRKPFTKLIQYESFRYQTSSNEFLKAYNSDNSLDAHQTEETEELLMTVDNDSEHGESEDVKSYKNPTLDLEDLNIPMQPDEIFSAKRPKYVVRPDGMFECVVCEQTYDNRDSCRQHCSSHETLVAELYKCLFCSKCFGKKGLLQTHEKVFHSDKIIKQNNVQTADSSELMAGDNLLDDETNNSLEECQENCTKEQVTDQLDAGTASDHKDQDSDDFSAPDDVTPIPKKKKTKLKRTFHYPEEDGLYHCQYCTEMFSAKPKYLNHLYVHRALLAGRYKCQYCSRCFGKKWNVQKHEELVHQDKVAEKDPSSKPSYPKSWTLTHKRVYYTPEADGLFHCRYCQMKIENRRKFVDHVSKHRNLLKGSYKCQYCGKCFGRKYDLVKHEELVHREEEAKKDPSKPYKKKAWSLTHERVYYKPEADGLFHCQHCEMKIENRRRFVQHMSTHRNIMTGRYKCQYCSKCFGKKSGLNKHEELVHRDEEAEKDPSKPYRKKAWTLNHERVFHKPEADGLFHCQYCEMKIADRNRFVEHMCKHRNILNKSHKCRFCKKCFGTKWYLQKHEREVHRHENAETDSEQTASSNIREEFKEIEPNEDLTDSEHQSFEDETNNTLEETQDNCFQGILTKEEITLSENSDTEFDFEELFEA